MNIKIHILKEISLFLWVGHRLLVDDFYFLILWVFCLFFPFFSFFGPFVSSLPSFKEMSVVDS